jgi:hypothetical protein
VSGNEIGEIPSPASAAQETENPTAMARRVGELSAFRTSHSMTASPRKSAAPRRAIRSVESEPLIRRILTRVMITGDDCHSACNLTTTTR